jgi:HD superfamily phosphohydrolase
MSEIRDPIHGFISPTDTELKIINCAALQRLRRIKQLAMAFLAYPGANHTRFDHSLGTYHIAARMADNLLPNKEDEDKRSLIKNAALLHDVGHGPFSHISEYILQNYASSNDTTDTEKIHEKITRDIIEKDKELIKLLSPDKRSEITGLLSGNRIDLTLMKDIVTGPLDADKMDYLLRDSYYCGVKYGVFDLERLLNTLTKYSDSQDEHIAVKYDGVNSLEQFALAKYYMTKQVYRHKTRSVSDAMIIRGIELGIEKDEIEWLRKLYSYECSDSYIDNYQTYSDEKVVNKILDSNQEGMAHQIFRRLYKRNLFKIIFSKNLRELKDKGVGERLRDWIINLCDKNSAEKRKQIEQEIARIDLLDCPSDFIILNSYMIKSVKEMSKDSEGNIIIVKSDESKRQFDEDSTVFKSIDDSIKDIIVEVYAPLEYKDIQDKEKKIKTLTKEILEMLLIWKDE